MSYTKGELELHKQIGELECTVAKMRESNALLREACKHAYNEWTLHGALTDSARVLKQAIKKA